MKVLIADAFPRDRIADIAALGVEVEHRPDVAVKDLPAAVAAASILVVRGKQVPAEVFEKGDALSLVIRAGAGVNTIDVGAASRRGVYVANCPGQNAIAVAELALGLMVALDRRIPDNVALLRAGKWDKKTFSEAGGLYGRTLGIVGLGSIGRETARRGQGFGMRILAWSPSLDDPRAKELGVERARDVLSVARGADVLSLHLPLAKETRGIVGREVIAAMKAGAILVNTARAELVDQEALLEAARAGRIRVGLDVHAGEPEKGQADFDSELARLPNVYGTHHIGASTAQAQDAIAREVVRILQVFLREGSVPNCVNIARKTPARARLVVRHHDKVGVLANVLDTIREAGINVEEVENTVFEHAAAACCTIQLDERPSDALLERIRGRKDEIIFLECFDL
ncbi:MAG TPA: 3-phosphoglycerate dehydrogenase family protein [Anaeromyxobacteraceae bacterium]|nr:3-phosphoglycerate dehydrogenase family protein [Anaeromyxobacteraceae bacterium]